MRGMHIFRLLSFAAAIAVALTLAGTASASDLYASPGGSTSGTTCPAGSPCSLQRAIQQSAVNDTINLAPGTYGSLAAPIADVGADLYYRSYRGVPGNRPTVYATTSTKTVAFSANYGDTSDLNVVVVQRADLGYPLLGFGASNGSIQRVAVTGSMAWDACLGDQDISNSICVNDRPSGGGIYYAISAGGAIPPRTYTYRNVLAAGLAYGIEAHSDDYVQTTLNVQNSIVSGDTKDIVAVSNGANGATLTVTAEHSNFDTVLASGPATVTSPGTGTNQTSAPLLDSDHRPLEGSPTIDAGDDATTTGTTDLDNTARIQGAAVDIGPYEYSVAVPGATPTGQTPILAPVTPVAPTASKFKQSARRFKAARTGAAFQSASRAKRKSNAGRGATVSFQLTAPGTMHFRLFKRVTKEGKKSWRLAKGVESVAASAGANKFWFSGRWKKKALVPGVYQLRGTPTLAGGTIKTSGGDEPGTVKAPSVTIVK